MVTRRAAERHVVTASKCGNYCFDSYLIPFRNCAVIMRRHFLCLHGDRRGGIFYRQPFDAVDCRCYKLLFYGVVTHSGFSTCGELKQGKTRLQGHLAHDCIFQHSAVKTGLEDKHTVLVSGRKHAWWLQTTHEGQSGGLLPKSASFPEGCTQSI